MNRFILLTILVGLLTSTQVIAVPTQETFETPAQAADALFDAATKQNTSELTKIFGQNFINEISSGDPIADKFHIERLGEAMRDGRQVVARNNGTQIVEIGDSRIPFPAPLVERDGRWQFNSILGAEEVINRRIGENELRAINVAHFIVDAQNLYHSKDRTGNGPTYAQKFLSSPNKKDGLYWPPTMGETSPLGPLFERAISEGYSQNKTDSPAPYQGYYYRILTKQGSNSPGGTKNYLSGNGKMTEGFAMIAYPARWGVGGIMTFTVGTDGIVYEKNFGKKTGQIASTTTKFDPDSSWTVVTEQ